jgi:(E)-4-hydroxy-3-methylbut-2-enyl-diphosphate synthase
MEVERQVEIIKKKRRMPPAKIAIMGCAVNGPGEAKDADIGISGAKNGRLIIFKKGKIIGAYEEKEGFNIFISELKKLTRIFHENHRVTETPSFLSK